MNNVDIILGRKMIRIEKHTFLRLPTIFRPTYATNLDKKAVFVQLRIIIILYYKQDALVS